ncbi:unnamed protein product [Gongylonema pulchrum]|uniref:DEK_C domain-containing protein n=1 Tax=Gongylonema pulchrum TaxID=637853 RepID=A0A183D3X5_9BILA|nr:unnamed protein product [Gongylonema pulchrum]
MFFSCDANPEDVKKKVKEEVHDLIREHQRLPGSILHGILQRLVSYDVIQPLHKIDMFYDRRRCKQNVLLERMTSNNTSQCSNNNTQGGAVVVQQTVVEAESSPDVVIPEADGAVALVVLNSSLSTSDP